MKFEFVCFFFCETVFVNIYTGWLVGPSWFSLDYMQIRVSRLVVVVHLERLLHAKNTRKEYALCLAATLGQQLPIKTWKKLYFWATRKTKVWESGIRDLCWLQGCIVDVYSSSGVKARCAHRFRTTPIITQHVVNSQKRTWNKRMIWKMHCGCISWTYPWELSWLSC